MSKYIWYSGATDITGKALEDALGLTSTKVRPKNLHAEDIVLGWGTKTKEDVVLAGTILNHPNKIRANRNKFKSLGIMAANKDLKASIATFCTADNILRDLGNKSMKFPLVGRTNFHQGGKGFWLCLTKQHVDKAVADGAQYFQTYIDIKGEYRLHVAFGKIIYAVKKIENPGEAGWIAQRKEKIEDYAKKNNVDLNADTVDYVLKRLVKEADLPDRIVRSNRRGWKFSSVQLNNLVVSLKNAAIKSVAVAGLDFGAVDCALSADGLPYIIEINSGPGLKGTALQKYIDAFAEKIATIENPRPNPARRVVNVARDVVGRAVGAAPANDLAKPKIVVNEEAVFHMMNAVQNPEEARKLLDLLNKA